MSDGPLASLSLTHVHYDPTDTLSYLCAWLALLPQALCLVYATLLYTTREAEIILTFCGQLACEALNWGLKRYFKQARPRAMTGKGYGMPSSHAQFASFFAVSVGLFLMWRHAPASPALRGRGGRVSDVYRLQLHHPRVTHAVLTAGAAGAAGLVAGSRVYLRYHTPAQVAVGGVVGAVFAVGWFGVTEWVRRKGWVAWVLEWEVVRKARVRDLLCEEDLVEIGWQVWEEKRRRRREGEEEAAAAGGGQGKRKKK